MTDINAGQKITDLYPDHTKALSKEQKHQEEQEEKLHEKQEKRKSSRDFFCNWPLIVLQE
eukprot:9284100-Ditylum_brightwellii.AAC.1